MYGKAALAPGCRQPRPLLETYQIYIRYESVQTRASASTQSSNTTRLRLSRPLLCLRPSLVFGNLSDTHQIRIGETRASASPKSSNPMARKRCSYLRLPSRRPRARKRMRYVSATNRRTPVSAPPDSSNPMRGRGAHSLIHLQRKGLAYENASDTHQILSG
jgi:hypothetical protein